jgi:hypothetical protein
MKTHILTLPERTQALYGEYSKKMRDYFSDLASAAEAGAARALDRSCQVRISANTTAMHIHPSPLHVTVLFLD